MTEDSKLCKLTLYRPQLERTQLRKFMPRQRKPILDYRVIRGDRLVMLTDDGTLVTMDTFTGLELVTHSGPHSNIFTFNGDQVNIEAHSYALEEEDGRLWLANMRGGKEKVSRKAHVKFLSQFQPLA